MLTLAILNHLIQQNVDIQAQWQLHQGRVLTWVLPMITLHGRIDAQGFWQPDDAKAEIIITVPTATLTKMVSGERLGVGDVLLQGDQQLGLAILPLLQGLHYDWRDDLARLCGDMVGGVIANQLDQYATTIKSSKNDIVAQISDYASEKDAVIVGRKTFVHFNQQVVKLRDDEARLEQRLLRLQQKIKIQ